MQIITLTCFVTKIVFSRWRLLSILRCQFQKTKLFPTFSTVFLLCHAAQKLKLYWKWQNLTHKSCFVIKIDFWYLQDEFVFVTLFWKLNLWVKTVVGGKIKLLSGKPMTNNLTTSTSQSLHFVLNLEMKDGCWTNNLVWLTMIETLNFLQMQKYLSSKPTTSYFDAKIFFSCKFDEA